MAHQWNSCFHNLQPLSGDSRTLRVPLDSEETTYSSISPYSHMPCQNSKQLTDQDNLLKNGPSNLLDLVTDGLPSKDIAPSSTGDLNNIQQGCEMLNSSFLDEHSDVGGCTEMDVDKIRLSCKDIDSNLNPISETQEIDSTKTNSYLELSCSSPSSVQIAPLFLKEKLAFPTQSLNVGNTPSIVGLETLSVLAEENKESVNENAKEKKQTEENLEDTVQGHEVSDTTKNTSTSAGKLKREIHSDSEKIYNVEEFETLIQKHQLFMPLSGHSGTLITSTEEENLDGVLEEEHMCIKPKQQLEATSFCQSSYIFNREEEEVLDCKLKEKEQQNEETMAISQKRSIMRTDEEKDVSINKGPTGSGCDELSDSYLKTIKCMSALENDGAASHSVIADGGSTRGRICNSNVNGLETINQMLQSLELPGSMKQNQFQDTIDKCSIQKNMVESDSLNKEQSMLNPLDHSLQLQNPKMNRQPCLENKLCIQVDKTKSYSFRNEAFLEQSRMLKEPSDKTVLCDESARESFQDVEGAHNQCLYGEPLSGEDSSCEVDFSDTTKFEYRKFGDSLVKDSEQSELSQLKSSAHMRKSLHPVVILETSDLRNTSEMYRCTACQHTAQNSDDLIEHHHFNHLLHNFEFCQTCNSYLTNATQSEEHTCEVTDGIPQLSIDNSQKKKSRAAYHCKYCKQTFSRLYVYVQHVRTHTGETPYKCHACGSYFAQCSSLKKHKNVPGRCQPLNPLVQVPKPKASPGNSDVLDRGITKKLVSSPKSPFISLPDCFVKLVDVCETHDKLKKHTYNLHKKSSSLSTRSVSRHQTNSEESEITKTYPCPLCPRVFKYSYNCGRHLRECIKDFTIGGRGKIGNRYQCPLCYTNFTNPSNRHRHIKNTCLKEQCKWHVRKQTIPIKNSNQIKPIQPSPYPRKQGFKCNFCPAVFSFASGKYRHMKKHELFKRTGKVFKYKRSSLIPVSNEPKCTEHCEETFPSNEASSSPSHACRFCGKCFGTTYSLKKHTRNHKGERPYRCLNCGKGFKQQAHLVSHKKVHQRRIQCTVCKKILPTIGELIKHRKTHLKRGMLQCPDCPLQFQYPAFLLRHMHSHKRMQEKSLKLKQKVTQLKPQSVFKTFHKVNKKLFKCSICHEVFPNAKVLRSHCLLHISGPSSCQCPFCKRNFMSRHSLLRHMHIHTSERSFTCRSCGKDFYRKENLQVHYKTCAKTEPNADVINIKKIDGCKKPLRCSYCPRTFSRKPRLAKHHKGHMSSTVKPCSKCGQFFGQNKYKAHERHCKTKISADVTCSCSHCGKTFPREYDRKVHEINCNSIEAQAMSRDNHQKNCPHCPMKFKYRTSLLRHLVSHTGGKPFACMHCGHTFGKRSRCLQHEAFCDGVYKRKNAKVKNVSTPRMLSTSSFKESKNKFQGESEGQYKCKFCTKSFIKPRTLRLHIMTHTDAKPYCCKLCDSCFSRYDHLKLHQNRCQGKRLRLEVHLDKISPGDVGKGWQDKTDILNMAKQQGFECNQCSRSFSSESNLGRHFSMLHASRPFSCSRCGSSFILEKYLKKHRVNKCQINNFKTNGSLKENGILKRIQTPSKQKHKYCCTYCPRFFKASEQLKVHTRLHTGDKPFCCENCSERFIRRDYLQRHLAKCNMRGESTDTVLCNRCGKTFSTDTINNHQKSCVFHARSSGSKQSTSIKPPMGFSCAYCSSRFLLFSQLQQHFLNTHRDNTPLMSPLKALPLQQELSSMVLLEEEPLDDSYDGTLLSSENDPRINQDLESNFEMVKPVPCPECNMRFSNKGALKAHMRVHSGKYPFTCKRCSKGFWNKKNQQNHIRKCRTQRNVIEGPIYDSVDTSQMDLTLKDSVLVFNKGSKTTGTGVLQTNFSCKDDSNGTTSQDTAHNQGQVGSFKEKKAIEYQCSECDQSFTDGLLLISHLEDHGRMEQNQKRNTCHKCGKICASPGLLERHMKVHVNHEAHSCPECFKTFRSASVLEIHKISHGKDGPDSEANVRKLFSCQVCKKSYSFRSSLVRHCRIRHSKDQMVLASLVKDKDDAKNVSTVKVYHNSESDTTPEDDKDGSSEDNDSDSAPYFPCHVCGKTFLTFESLEDHQRCHLGEKPHECAECGKCFFQAAQLQNHQRTHKTEFQCQTCGRGFVSLFALRKHKHTHGKSRPFRCSKCELSFKGPSHLAEHMATHRNENFPCDLCGQTFSSKISRAEHRKNHTVSEEIHPASDSLDERTVLPSPSESSSKLRVQPTYPCGVCNEHFRDTEQLSEHGCIAAKVYSCLDCDEHFVHQSHFEKHQLGHQQSTSYIYRCSKCHTTFSNHDSVLDHLKKHGDDEAKRELVEGTLEKGKEKATDNIYKCPKCSESYALATELLSHLSLHSDSAHQCEICKLVYPSKTKLDEHARCHLTAVTQFGCTEYGQDFVSSAAFQQHPCSRQKKLTKESKRLHFSTNKSPVSLNQATTEEDDVDVDGEDFYKCPACFRQFSSQSKVLEHQNKHHARKKPFKCELCGKAFVLKRYLKDHERRHRQKEKGENKASFGAKEFKCPHCSVSEDSLKGLSLHLRIHAEEETGDLRCDMCDKSFNQLSLLRLHQESHVGQVVYECTECDKAFAFPYLLEDHQQTHSSL